MVHLFEVIPAHTEFVMCSVFLHSKELTDALGRFDQRLGIFTEL